jgi:hypothetical protein
VRRIQELAVPEATHRATGSVGMKDTLAEKRLMQPLSC